VTEQHKSGTAFVNKGEPSATDAARLRRLTAGQKAELRQIMTAHIRHRSAAVLHMGDGDAEG